LEGQVERPLRLLPGHARSAELASNRFELTPRKRLLAGERDLGTAQPSAF
jgi:hypothetical protein